MIFEYKNDDALDFGLPKIENTKEQQEEDTFNIKEFNQLVDDANNFITENDNPKESSNEDDDILKEILNPSKTYDFILPLKDDGKSEVSEPKNSSSGPEVKTPTSHQHNLYLCSDESCRRILKTMMLQKMDYIKNSLEMASSLASAEAAKRHIIPCRRKTSIFEDYLVKLSRELSVRSWRGSLKPEVTDLAEDGPNILYLASALGLAELIPGLFQWLEANPHPILERELNCTSTDNQGYTPLVSPDSFVLILISSMISQIFFLCS